MDNNENLNKLEKDLYNYYKNQEVPLSTQNTIINAFKYKNTKKENCRILKHIVRAIIYIVMTLILGGSVAFAIYHLSGIFTNSTDAIDAAVEDNYFQETNSEYVYSNGIGIKTDYILIDDYNLNISFEYETDDESINSISIYEFIIRDENSNFIGYYLEDYTQMYGITTLSKGFTRAKKENFRESILFSLSDDTPDIENLNIEILSVKKFNNDSEDEWEVVEGEWLLNIALDDKMLSHSSEEYTVSENEYIDSISAVISETELNVKINFNIPFDVESFAYEHENQLVTLSNNSGTIFEELESTYDEYYLDVYFDVGLHNEDIDTLYLSIEMMNGEIINITLEK